MARRTQSIDMAIRTTCLAVDAAARQVVTELVMFISTWLCHFRCAAPCGLTLAPHLERGVLMRQWSPEYWQSGLGESRTEKSRDDRLPGQRVSYWLVSNSSLW